MHHLSIAARQQMDGVLAAEGWEKHGGLWRQLPLVTRLPAFTEPWKEYTLEDARKEFPLADHPLKEYFKHLVNRYVGEAVLVWEAWDPSAVGDDPLPRDARLWHHQFAKTPDQAKTLRWLRQNQKGEVDESVDLRKHVGDTTILRWRAGLEGPLRLRGGALTLPMLFEHFGSLFTAQELLFFYLKCKKVIRTKDHSRGSPEARGAAWARKWTYGKYGHGSHRKGP